jgi:tRNA A37 threonylcarbamoyladenosine modification protein TsaB
VLVLLEAGRGELFAAAWRERSELIAAAAMAPAAVAEAIAALDRPLLAVGNGSVRLRDLLEASGVAVPADDSPYHRVSAAELCRLAVGEPPVAPEALFPDYRRQPDAKPRTPTEPQPP